MNHLPVEVLEKIFTLACVDDGTTGRSLSLVSRYIHTVALASKLQSVAARGIVQILRFSEYLQKLPAPQRRVKYLFISYHFPNYVKLRKRQDDFEAMERNLYSPAPISNFSRLLKDMGARIRKPNAATVDRRRRHEQMRIAIAIERNHRESGSHHKGLYDILASVHSTVSVLSIYSDYPIVPRQSQTNRLFPHLVRLLLSGYGGLQMLGKAGSVFDPSSFASLTFLDLSGYTTLYFVYPRHATPQLPDTITEIILPPFLARRLSYQQEAMEAALRFSRHVTNIVALPPMVNLSLLIRFAGFADLSIPKSVKCIHIGFGPPKDAFTSVLFDFFDYFKDSATSDDRLVFTIVKPVIEDVEDQPMHHGKKWLDSVNDSCTVSGTKLDCIHTAV